MRLFLQMLQKDIDHYSEFMINKKYRKALTFFYGSYGLACAILNYEDLELKRKNKMWERYFLNGRNDKVAFNKIIKYSKRDIKVVSNAINFINAENEKLGSYGGEEWAEDKGYIAIYSFEKQD